MALRALTDDEQHQLKRLSQSRTAAVRKATACWSPRERAQAPHRCLGPTSPPVLPGATGRHRPPAHRGV